MTTTELVLVLCLAGAGGAAAGVAAGSLRGEDTAARDAANEIAARMDRMESRLTVALDEFKATNGELGKLRERMTEMELRIDPSSTGGTADGSANGTDRPGRAGRVVRVARPGGGTEELEVGDWVAKELPAEKLAGLRAQLEDSIRRAEPQLARIAALGEETGELRGFAEGMRMRMLPEEERWQKAQTDLGLNDTQVANLKQAVADRDLAMKDAFQVERETGESDKGMRLTIRTADPEKMKAAQETYDRKVNDTLDETQRKGWKEKGYASAFGKHGMGASGGAITVISASNIELQAPVKGGSPEPGSPGK